MKRPLLYSAASIAAVFVVALASRTAQSSGQGVAVVRLQGATPGATQTGNANLSGKLIAGQFQGNGAGLTNVDADSLGGLGASSYMLNAGPWTFSTSNPGATVTINNGLASNLALGLTVSSNGTAVQASSTTTSTVVYGGDFSTASTSGRGIRASATASTGTTYGGLFSNSSTTGRGLQASSTATTGANFAGVFTNASSAGIGVSATASANSGSTIGVEGQVNSPVGIGILGTSTASSGVGYGGYFESASTIGVGILGRNTALTGTSYGGRFEADSTSGRGVHGLSNATSGVAYGVLGQAATLADGYAVFAAGDMGSAGVKPFRIDHPADPLNKYLLHFSAESPFPQNFYSGNVTTDAKGYAWVELPDYFGLINANFKYQLTVVDDADADSFVMAKVSKRIRGNRFQVRTSEPNVEVSWRIEADRNDPYVQQKSPKDVVEKQGPEKGKYQMPELYGAPADMGTFNVPQAPQH